MRIAFGILGVAALSIVLTGCDEWAFGDIGHFKEDFHYTYTLRPGGRLSIETMNGSVEIMGWEKDSVDVSGTKFAGSQDVLDRLKIDAQSSPDSLALRTVTPAGAHGNYGAKYIVRVPRRVELDRIVSSNGAIRLEDLEGNGRLRTSNGSIKAYRTKGNYEAQTSNGSVELADSAGALNVRTSNGSIKAEGVRGALEAVTTNGGITARLAEPEIGRLVKLESSNGSVNLTLEACRDNDVRVGTSNSSITVRMPSSCGANVRANTSNSSITTDFDVNVRAGKMSKSHLEGTIGAGGPTLELTTSNGSIKVLKI